MSLHPWAEGPFELIVHGELHYRSGEDFDRRVALISFDNSIEVAIVTYLSLNPIQRNGRTYDRKDVDKWCANFHTKLDFWELETSARGVTALTERTYFVWYHDLRNNQYHGGSASTPNLKDLKGLREAALWVFSILYDVPNVEEVLEEELMNLLPPSNQQEIEQNDEYDKVLDEYYGDVELAGGTYKTSELLFQTDPNAYVERALELLEEATSPMRIVS